MKVPLLPSLVKEGQGWLIADYHPALRAPLLKQEGNWGCYEETVEALTQYLFHAPHFPAFQANLDPMRMCGRFGQDIFYDDLLLPLR